MMENEKNFNNKAGIRLKQSRKAKNITAEQLAEMMDVSTTTISNLECGRRNITALRAKQIGEILEVDPDFLLCKVDHPSRLEEAEEAALSEAEKDELIMTVIRSLAKLNAYKVDEKDYSGLSNETDYFAIKERRKQHITLVKGDRKIVLSDMNCLKTAEILTENFETLMKWRAF